MMRLLFDIETNGLPRQGLDHIHCVVVKDIDTEEVFRFNDTGNSDSITNAITFLQEADVLIGHNIVGFDIPVIQGIYPFFNPKATLFDTLILSRMFFPDILQSGLPQKAHWNAKEAFW
jgi:DNA polymerase I